MRVVLYRGRSRNACGWRRDCGRSSGHEMAQGHMRSRVKPYPYSHRNIPLHSHCASAVTIPVISSALQARFQHGHGIPNAVVCEKAELPEQNKQKTNVYTVSMKLLTEPAELSIEPGYHYIWKLYSGVLLYKFSKQPKNTRIYSWLKALV